MVSDLLKTNTSHLMLANNAFPSQIRTTLSKRLIQYSQVPTTIFCKLLMKLVGTVALESECNFQNDSNYLFVSNHQSRIDPFIIFCALPVKQIIQVTPMKHLTSKGIYNTPLKPFLKLLGCYPTRRRDVTVKESVHLLSIGYSICLFPEGKRSLQSESTPKPGVSLVINNALSVTPFKIILVHITWTRHAFFRRDILIRFKEAPNSLYSPTPDSLMEAVYKV